jgi:hypothetical protein
MVATGLRLPPCSTSFRLLRCIIFSGRGPGGSNWDSRVRASRGRTYFDSGLRYRLCAVSERHTAVRRENVSHGLPPSGLLDAAPRGCDRAEGPRMVHGWTYTAAPTPSCWPCRARPGPSARHGHDVKVTLGSSDDRWCRPRRDRRAAASADGVLCARAVQQAAKARPQKPHDCRRRGRPVTAYLAVERIARPEVPGSRDDKPAHVDRLG